jgi:hypothetical protein
VCQLPQDGGAGVERSSRVLKLLREDYVLISLYVDEKKGLPEA